MRKLKLFFACLLMAVLSIGQVWADSYTVTYTPTSSSAVSASGTAPTGSTAALTGNAGWQNPFLQLTYGKNAVLTLTGYEGCTITGFKMSMKSNTSKGKGSMTLEAGTTTLHSVPDAAFNTASWYGNWSTSAVDVDFTSVMTTDYTVDEDENIVITVTNHGTSNATNSLYIASYTITYEVSSGGSDPSLSVTPTSWNFGKVAASDVADKEFLVSGSNLTAGTLSISVPTGFSVSPSSISVTEATLASTPVTVSKNTSTIADYSGNLSFTGCGLEEAKNVALEMSVVADPEPTGTFEPFSGDIEEGDYLIVADGAGMNTTVSSNRLQYTALTLTGENYVNPDESVIWHIAESATVGYWTIYSGAESKYAAATGSNNQAQMLESGTDNKSLWGITHSEAVYTITNKSNSRFLKKNGTYGFACYADGTVSLYKKQVEGQPKAPTFSIPGGNYETAQSVELSCETEDVTIHYTLDGTTPTNASPVYSTALAISSTTTIKAIAIKNDVSSTVASATYTIVVWQTVDEIWSSITSEGPTNANVWGYVSQANVGGYNNNYYISVDGSLTANQLEIYKGDNAGNTVAVGDKVHVNGDLTIFNEIKEFKQNTGVIVHYAAKGALQSVAVDGTPTKTEYATNETFDPAGLKVYGTYANGFVGEIAEGITWGNDLTDGKVTENTTVHVTATVSGITSPAYEVPVTVAAKTLVSIAVDVDSYTIYTGEALPQPNVTATYSEGDPENVNALAVYDSENVFNTATIDNPDPQTITVSYTFGGATETTTYTVSVQDYENADNAPYSVTEALHIITAAIGNTESAREIVVTGTVSEENISNNKNRYKISDSTNELLVYAGKGFNNENFTNTNYPKVGDVVKVKGKVINYSNNTPEFASGKSYLLSQVRPATLATEAVTNFEVGSADIEVADLTFTTASDGVITFSSSNHEEYVKIVDGKLRAVAPGTATITANLAATENVDALNYAATSTTFSVTVVAPATKYAITFDGNGADGGTAPTAIPDKAAGAEVTLPANTYTYTGHSFTGWKVYDENEDEVTVTAGAFTMPASPVTIKAQWAEISVWATTYTSNVTLTTVTNAQDVKVVISETEYGAVKAGTGKAGGSIKVTVPAQATTLHLHAAGWSGENPTISIDAPDGVTVSMASISATADAGINSNSPFTLENDPIGQYIALSLSGNTDEIELTFSVDGGNKRFVLFGVNQEGGIVPVLKSIAISGDLDNKSYKAGQSLDMTGLTVTATYQLGEETPYNVDVTNDPGLSWTYDPLVENQDEVTVTAHFGDPEKTASKTIEGLTVASADPLIITNPVSSLNWGTVIKDATAPTKTITVTLQNVDAATAALDGTNPTAFSINDTEIADGDVITVSVVSTATEGFYSAKVILTDNAGQAPDKEINLSITIEDAETPVSTTSEWVPATAADLVDGKVVLITGVKSDVTYAMGEQKSNNRSAVAGTLNEGVFTPGENTLPFTLVATGETDTYYIKASNDKYLYNASTSGNSYLRTKAENEDASWTITLDGDGNAVITSVENTNRTLMRFNLNGTSTPLFNCYASGQQSVKLYVPKPVTPTTYNVNIATGIEHGTVAADPTSAEADATVTLTITPADGYELSTLSVIGDVSGDEVTVISNQFTMPAEAVTVNATFSLIPTPVYETVRTGLEVNRYYTVCLPKKVTAIKGASFWTLNNKSQDGATAYLEEETNNLPFAAGKPFIIQATAENLEVVYEGDATEVAGINGALHGTLVYMNAAALAAAGSDVYMLFNNVLCPVGENNHLDANRAYVLLSELNAVAEAPQGAPGKRVVAMPMQKDEAQGFDNLESGDAPKKVMIDGTLYILRGEKVYDATGRLVK